MFALGLLLSVAYWPGFISPAMSPRWAVLSVVATGLLLWRREAVPFTRAHLAGLALIAWAALSVAWSPQPLDSMDALWQTVALPSVCFCLGSQERSLRPLFLGAAVGLGVSGAVAIGQLCGWVTLPEVQGPSGLFVNRNYMAEPAALVAVWLAAEGLWWWLLPVAPAALLPMARGALLGFAAAMGARYRVAAAIALAGLAAVTLARPGAISGMGERFDIWEHSVAGLSWLGSGIGSFWAIHRELYPGGLADHAHNDFLELASDLGPIGLALLGWLAWELRGPLDSARLVLVALAAEACFSFPTHLPLTVALGALCAGHAVRGRPVVCGIPLRGRGVFQESYQ
jgi:hypothetical protein